MQRWVNRARVNRALTPFFLLAAGLVAGCTDSAPDVEGIAAEAPYAREYPLIGYATSQPSGRVGALVDRVAAGETELRHEPGRGYLESVLSELGLDVTSQVLVFSRTSLQVRQIRPETPRAIYFNDDTYVAWVPGAPALEIASFDPELGPVFHTIAQEPSRGNAPERKLGTCLRCHDTYGLSGGGVPRFLLGSGYIGTEGELVSHEAWILTGQDTPLRSRWGGWYVTGNHGEQVHLGNIVVERPEDLQDLEALRVGNVASLEGLIDTSLYPSPYSDIVALLVLEHQVEVQNLISRLRFEALGRPVTSGDGESASFAANANANANAAAADATAADATADPLAGHVEALVRAMLMVDAIELTAPIAGTSGFTERFEARGPYDTAGRSLRQLDLETRLFRYPLSYLIYSEGFQALPQNARSAVYARLTEILEASPETDGLEQLTPADRVAIAEILRDTLPEVFTPIPGD